MFIDNANEKHNMILLKHFTEKNQAAVVDIKTRKRKTGEFSHRTAESSLSQSGPKDLDTETLLFWVTDKNAAAFERILWENKCDL